MILRSTAEHRIPGRRRSLACINTGAVAITIVGLGDKQEKHAKVTIGYVLLIFSLFRSFGDE